jgi:hypothetical protein
MTVPVMLMRLLAAAKSRAMKQGRELAEESMTAVTRKRLEAKQRKTIDEIKDLRRQIKEQTPPDQFPPEGFSQGGRVIGPGLSGLLRGYTQGPLARVSRETQEPVGMRRGGGMGVLPGEMDFRGFPPSFPVGIAAPPEILPAYTVPPQAAEQLAAQTVQQQRPSDFTGTYNAPVGRFGTAPNQTPFEPGMLLYEGTDVLQSPIAPTPAPAPVAAPVATPPQTTVDYTNIDPVIPNVPAGMTVVPNVSAGMTAGGSGQSGYEGYTGGSTGSTLIENYQNRGGTRDDSIGDSADAPADPVAADPVATTPVATTPVATTPVAAAPVETTPAAVAEAPVAAPVATVPADPVYLPPAEVAPVVAGPSAAEILAAEQAAADVLAAQEAEELRIAQAAAAAQAAEQEAIRIANEQAAAELLAQQEAERIAIEQAAAVEAERLAAETLAAQEAAAQAEATRLAEEEAQRIAAEQAAADAAAAQALADEQAALEALAIRQAAEEAAALAAEQEALAAAEAERVAAAQLASEQLAAQQAAQLAADQEAAAQLQAAEQLAAQQEADRIAMEAQIAATPDPDPIYDAPTQGELLQAAETAQAAEAPLFTTPTEADMAIDRGAYARPTGLGLAGIQSLLNRVNLDVADTISPYTTGFPTTQGMDIQRTYMPFEGTEEERATGYTMPIYKPVANQTMPSLFRTRDDTGGVNTDAFTAGSAAPGPESGIVNTGVQGTAPGTFGLESNEMYQCPNGYVLSFENGNPICNLVGGGGPGKKRQVPPEVIDITGGMRYGGEVGLNRGIGSFGA